MGDADKIRSGLRKLHGKIKRGKEISEEDVRVAFVKSGILEELDYEGELRDIKFEVGVKGKRSDLLAFDEYRNVVFVIEFKRPDKRRLDEHFPQLWERYVKPLKAKYGLLTDGLELVVYERVNSNWERKPRINLSEVTLTQCEEIYGWLSKPRIERTDINEVLKYFERFDKTEERINLSSEVAQKHFFESFELSESSVFVGLLQETIGLFDFELERSTFLKSAYNFWKAAYAKKPERVPESWKKILDEIGLTTSEEDLYKFMFCLETAYALFTRLILAKACEDYRLPYIDFSKFIKDKIRIIAHAQRGGITLLAWAVTARDLIENMKEKLVKSVFEGDIFYWWVDSYKELKPGSALYSPRHEKQKGYFGEALADIILTLYKFDFSEIVGDPLGTLYQRYFDKETRKALGEFYTPKEVVEYIIDAVGYEGRGIVGKRLLDPACGSGTFLVESLKRYLRVAEASGEEMHVALKKLCNEFQIVGFDIHPFATFMAQMQFMLVLIPAYKQAMKETRNLFVLNRLPIFRTDSLVDETKGEARKVTLETFANGQRFISVDTGLPVNSGNLKIKMPYDKDVFSRSDLLNVQEYFAALQAVFDTVKASAWQGIYGVDTEKLERNFKHYLQEKDWNKLVSFFTPYAQHFLEKFKELKETFGDGRLIKSIEDIILAAILKNYVKYDFVVGNPPYVRQEGIPSTYKMYLMKNFDEIFSGRNDLSTFFIKRGIDWLQDEGSFGYIVSNKFMKANYGVKLRASILGNVSIKQLLDFGDTPVFSDVTAYPLIFILEKPLVPDNAINIVDIKEAIREKEAPLNYIKSHFSRPDPKFFTRFDVSQKNLTSKEWNLVPVEVRSLIDRIKASCDVVLGDLGEVIMGMRTGLNDAFIVGEGEARSLGIEEKILGKCVKGKDINRYRIDYDGSRIIYPNFMDMKDFPNAMRYLTKQKTELESRAQYRGRSDMKWYEIEQPVSPAIFEKPKILTPDISKSNRFALDEVGYYYLDTCFGFVPDKENQKHLKFLLGVLNSPVLEFMLRQISPHVQNKYYRYKKQYLEPLPIRFPQTKKEQKLADKITEKVNLILEKVELEQKIEKFPEDYIREYRSRGVEFDPPTNIIFNSNHKAIEPVIEESIDGGFNVLIGRKEKSVFADSRVKADYVVTALKERRAKKNEKWQILVPKSDAVVEEIIGKLEEDTAATKTPSVAELEGEINELVYMLYGLEENDKKVIGEFLEKF